MDRNPNRLILTEVYHESVSTTGSTQTHTNFENKLKYLLPESTWSASSPQFLDLLYTKQIVAIPRNYIAPLNIAITHVDITQDQLAANLYDICKTMDVDMTQLAGFRIEKPPDSYYIMAVTLMVAVATGKTNVLISQIMEKCAGILVDQESIQGLLQTLNRPAPNNGSNEQARRVTRPKVQLNARLELQQATGIAMIHKQAELMKKLELQQERMVSMIDYSQSLGNEAERMGLGNALNARRQFLQNQRDINYLQTTRPAPRYADITSKLKNFINNLSYKSFLIRLLKLNFRSEELLKINVKLLKDHEKAVVDKTVNEAFTNSTGLGFGTIGTVHLRGLFAASDQVNLSQEAQYSIGLEEIVLQLDSLDIHRVPEYIDYVKNNQVDARLGNTITGSEQAEIENNRIKNNMKHALSTAREREMMNILTNPNFVPAQHAPLYRRGDNADFELPAPQPIPLANLEQIPPENPENPQEAPQNPAGFANQGNPINPNNPLGHQNPVNPPGPQNPVNPFGPGNLINLENANMGMPIENNEVQEGNLNADGR